MKIMMMMMKCISTQQLNLMKMLIINIWKNSIIVINHWVKIQKHIKDCYQALHINNMDELCFLSIRNKVYSIQWINLILKELKYRYNLKIDHFSTHSLRKTFGRKVFESSDNAELALVKLMELFNHSSIAITKRYLGLRQEEILETYDVLSF